MASKYAGLVQEELRDLRGNAMTGAVVKVLNAGTSVLATLYNKPVLIASATGADALVNDAVTGLPVAAGLLLPGLDANANYTFFADSDAEYDLNVIHQGTVFTYRVRPNVHVPSGTYVPTAGGGTVAAGGAVFDDTPAQGAPKRAVRLDFNTAITALNRAGDKEYSLVRMNNNANIDAGIYDNMLIGDRRCKWLSLTAAEGVDIIGGDIIDVQKIGNKLGDYSTRLVQDRDITAPNALNNLLALATRDNANVLTDRVVLNHGQSRANSHVKILQSNLLVGETASATGITTAIGMENSPGFVGDPADGGAIIVQGGALRFRGSHGAYQVILDAFVAGKTPLLLKGAASQTAPLFRIQDSASVDVVGVSADGDLMVGSIQHSGKGAISLNNAVTVPAANHPTGGYLYAEGGALKWRGSAGTITTIAPA